MGNSEKSAGREKTVKYDGVKTSITCKKVFVSLLDNGYTFRKKKTWGKRELGSFRAQFVCTECDKMDVFLSAYCSVHVLDFDVEELDEYQVQTLPTPEEGRLFTRGDWGHANANVLIYH